MDILKLIQSANNPAEINMLLQAMGQTSTPSNAIGAPSTPNPDGERVLRMLASANNPAEVANYLTSLPAARQEFSSKESNKSNPVDPVAELQAALDAQYAQEMLALDVKAATDAQAETELAATLYDRQPTDIDTIPSTGHAGADRVNANTKIHGGMASVDSAGRVTLTNIKPDGTITPESQTYDKPVPFVGSLDKTTSVKLDDTLKRLQQSQDFNEARVLSAQVRTAIVEEEARIRNETLETAANQAGVPSLRQRLAASEKLDQQTPGYRPGMGDSSNTRTLRTQLFQAEDQARQNADALLSSNISYGRLKIADQTLSQETQRLERLSSAAVNRANAAEIRADARREDDERRTQNLYDSLDPAQRAIIARLNPAVAAPGNEKALVAYFDKQIKVDPEFKEVITANVADLPRLAITNSKARTLVAQQEAELTGRSIPEIERELATVANRTITKEDAATWAKIKATQISTNSKDRNKNEQDLLAEFTKSSFATTAAGKARQEELKQEIALTLYQAQRAAKFSEDVTSWRIPELEEAAQKAVRITGKADVQSVLTQFVGDKTGPEALAAYTLFKEYARTMGARESQSVYGGVNLNSILSTIENDAIKNTTLAGWWKDRFQKGTAAGMQSMQYMPIMLGTTLMNRTKGE